MTPPRPASGDTIYIIHASGPVTISMSMLACQCSQPKRPGDLGLLTLKVVSESRVTYVSILVFLGLCSRLRSDVRDRQTSHSIIA